MKEGEKFSKDKIIQYLNGELDNSGKSELYNWIKKSDQNFRYYLELKEVWDLSALGKGMNGADTDSDWNEISDKINISATTTPVIRKIGVRFLRYAAIFIVGFGLALAGSYIHKNDLDDSTSYNQVIVPKGQKSIQDLQQNRREPKVTKT